MLCQIVYSVVIFSHKYLGTVCINFKTIVFLAVYWSIWTSSYNTDIRVQKCFKWNLHNVKQCLEIFYQLIEFCNLAKTIEAIVMITDQSPSPRHNLAATLWYIKGEVSPDNNVDWVSRKQFYKPNSKSLSRFG